MQFACPHTSWGKQSWNCNDSCGTCLCGCETWKMKKLVNMFQNKCLHGILRAHWSKHTHMRTEDLLEWAQMKSLSKEVKARRWKMIGDILIKDQKFKEWWKRYSDLGTWRKKEKEGPRTTWQRMMDKEWKKGALELIEWGVGCNSGSREMETICEGPMWQWAPEGQVQVQDTQPVVSRFTLEKIGLNVVSSYWFIIC